MVRSDKQNDGTVITLLPNRSATWEETRIFLYVICGTTLVIGLLWAILGLWAVLPFSGLEAALVAFVMYRVNHSTWQRQVITFTQQQVMVQFGSSFPKRSWVLERGRTHLSVTEPQHHLDAVRLRIFDPEHSIELGAFLNKDDREAALDALKQAGLQVRSFDREGRMDL